MHTTRRHPRSTRLLLTLALLLAPLLGVAPAGVARATIVYPNSMAATGNSLTSAQHTGTTNSANTLYLPLAVARTTVVYPNSIAALGDSITGAYNTGSRAFANAPENSWSMGTTSSVNSLYLRILAQNPAINGQTYTTATPGAKMSDLVGQLATVQPHGAEYVTVLIGATDVCTSSEATMTSVATFRTQFQTALDRLALDSPNTRVYVVSIPNIYQLWTTLKDNPTAHTTWSSFGICQSMLANPLSTSQADVERRARVQQRNIDFNTQLAQVCAAYPTCRFDNHAVFNTVFSANEVSTRDYFHPSLAGQAKLAKVSWSASRLAP